MALPPIDELFDALTYPDAPRATTSFTSSFSQWQTEICRAEATREEREQVLNDWLSKEQPCLFGRWAAKQRTISFSILTETDVMRGDDHVASRIRKDRDAWRARALRGAFSGFVIVLVSARVAQAVPDERLSRLAQKLLELYLNKEGVDLIHHDTVDLRASDGIIHRWKVGANVFAAAADGSWWHDHRMPGGVALSMNSVGHFARSLHDAAVAAGRIEPPIQGDRVTWALPLAVRTILNASKGPIPGTRLVARQEGEASPFEALPPDVAKRLAALLQFSAREYEGNYHTDQTIPSAYFDVQAQITNFPVKPLLFTYLFDESDEDFTSMGLGERILGEELE